AKTRGPAASEAEVSRPSSGRNTSNRFACSARQDLSWLKASLAPADYAKLEEGNTERPPQQAPYGIQARNLAKINTAGVKIVLGTDGNRAWSPHEEAADMVAAGMTPMQVIIAATKNAAEFLKMSDTGTLEVGKNADFIVLDA